jgi:hypothetical protein
MLHKTDGLAYATVVTVLKSLSLAHLAGYGLTEYGLVWP